MIAAVDAPGPDALTVAPLLIVEVTSPSTRRVDRERKAAAYARGGCPWYWVVDLQDEVLTILERQGDEYASRAQLGRGRHRIEEPVSATLDLDALLA